MRWKDRLLQLRETNDGYKMIEAVNDAQNWGSCAVGENRERLKNLGMLTPLSGSPTDPKLETLGNDFNCAVRRAEWSTALTLLDEIESRITELEILAEKKGNHNGVQ